MSLQTLIGVPIDAPPLSPPAAGLVAVADVVEGGSIDAHWLSGISWSPEGGGIGDPYGFMELCATAVTVSGFDRVANRDYLPFWVVTHDKCGSWASDVGDYQARARRHLQAIESTAVEEQFERGTLTTSAPNGAFARLNEDDASVIKVAGSVAQTPRRALALLNQTIADAKIGQGMIHVSSMLGQLLLADRALEAGPAGRWITANGNLVVIGTGYWGDGPGGADGHDGDSASDHTNEWAYATDKVRLVRGEIVTFPETVGQALDRSINNIEFWSARPWAIQWSRLLHAAVKVTV